MKTNFVNIVFVIDESGSMAQSRNDVIGGFNTFIKEQKDNQQGKLIVSLYTFNTGIKRVHVDKDISEIQDLSAETYIPGGGTALNDAIGIAITETGKKLAALPEEDRPANVMVVIMTDGEENSSRRYSLQQVREMIKQQEDVYSWKFVYIGSELEDAKQANNLGFKSQAYIGRGSENAVFKTVGKLAHGLMNLDNMAFDLFDNDLAEMTADYEAKSGKKVKK